MIYGQWFLLYKPVVINDYTVGDVTRVTVL